MHSFPTLVIQHCCLCFLSVCCCSFLLSVGGPLSGEPFLRRNYVRQTDVDLLLFSLLCVCVLLLFVVSLFFSKPLSIPDMIVSALSFTGCFSVMWLQNPWLLKLEFHWMFFCNVIAESPIVWTLSFTGLIFFFYCDCRIPVQKAAPHFCPESRSGGLQGKTPLLILFSPFICMCTAQHGQVMVVFSFSRTNHSLSLSLICLHICRNCETVLINCLIVLIIFVCGIVVFVVFVV